MFVQTIAAIDNPVTLAEAKNHLRVDHSDDDTLIASLLKGATRMAEVRTNRSLMQQTWEWRGSDWPRLDVYYTNQDILVDREGWMRFRPAPLVQVNSVKYYTATVLTTLASSNYLVDSGSVPGRFKYSSSLVSTGNLDDRSDAVIINFTSGYGIISDTTAQLQQAKIPEDIKAWIKIQLGTLYEMRQEFILNARVDHIRSYCDGLLYDYILPF